LVAGEFIVSEYMLTHINGKRKAFFTILAGLPLGLMLTIVLMYCLRLVLNAFY